METEGTPLPAHKPAFLRRVQIRGYKSIAFCDVTLEPLTILVGRNSSGKSNFLDALGFLRDVVKYGVREAVKQHGGADAILCKSIVNSTTVRFEIDCCFEAMLIVELKTPSKQWLTQYRLDISFQNLSNPVISLEACHCKPDDGTPSEKFSAKDGRFNMPERVPSSIRTDIFHVILKSAMDGPYGRLADLIKSFQNHSFNPDVLRVPQSPAPYQPLDFNGSNLSSVLETTQAIDAGSVMKIGRYLNSIVPQILFSGAVRVAGYQILNFRSPIGSELNDLDFNASSMSDGTLRALAALTAVFQNVHEDQDLGLVAIEEPETALHPAAMRALVSAFDAATMRTQILLTTHSPDLLDAEEIKPENVRIVQMIDGQTVIGPIDEASVEIVRRNLDTLGGLERNDSLQIDYDDRQRQIALANQSSDGQS